jgi:hypothetical protein
MNGHWRAEGPRRDINMNVEEIFTPDSIAEFRRRTVEARQTGQRLVDQYRREHEDQLRDSPDLRAWIDALEDGDLDAASDPGLWTRLCAAGFIEVVTATTPHPDHGVFHFKIISPRVFDGFRTEGGPRADYAFTTVKACLRRSDVHAGVAIPEGWTETAVVDTELFELPPNVSEDNVDDLEKIHLIYLVGNKDGQFVCTPIYIGVGSGEPYGTGPHRRTGRGRFRLYRYDLKENFHLEHVRMTEGRQEERENVESVPPVPAIKEATATLLLAKTSADRSFLSISDPEVAENHALWLKQHPQNRLVFREVMLEKVHDDLRTGRPTTQFPPDEVAQVLADAWRVQRWYYVAWQHPRRLSDAEGIALYYDQLPSFRREEYEIYRFKPEVLGLSPGDPGADDLTVPRVLRTEHLRGQLQPTRPDVLKRLERWLREGVSKDLYAYGSHPELRLCSAIALWTRLEASGLWDRSIEAAYGCTLYAVDFSTEKVCSGPEDGRGERGGQ